MPFLNTSGCRWMDRNWHGLPGLWLVLAGALFSGVLRSPAQAAPSREYQIKAVFLFNFAQFVEWPSVAFAGSNSPLVIGILGGGPFGAYLDENVRDEKVNNRPLAIQRYRQGD